MKMTKSWNVSSSPHVRTSLTTRIVMYDVILALVPTTCIGIYNFGLSAVITIAASIVSAMLTEFVFDYMTGKENTLSDCSAVVTGLLLALSLPSSLPVYVPVLGAAFAILVVKCFFGGLGKNFMNPALGGRVFLLLSFGSIMTSYTMDGVTSATPLAAYAAGDSVSVLKTWLGLSNGVIGGSAIGLLLGGIYLLAIHAITIEIPAACLISFTAVIVLLGGQGFDVNYILLNLAGGGILMGAIFMATDPVTSPVTSTGQLLFGMLTGVLCGVLRIYGTSADSVSYGIVLANLAVPLIDEISVPVPFGLQTEEEKEDTRPAIVVYVAVVAACLLVWGAYSMTRDTISNNELAQNAATYQEVFADAQKFSTDSALTAAIESVSGSVYGTAFGNSYVEDAVICMDGDGQLLGYIIAVSTSDGFAGNISLMVGVAADGTVSGITFTEINETAGLGMRCAEDSFMSQFAGVVTDFFVLNKDGNATADNEIDTVSGASTTSGAVVNAVNAALDFYGTYIQ